MVCENSKHNGKLEYKILGRSTSILKGSERWYWYQLSCSVARQQPLWPRIGTDLRVTQKGDAGVYSNCSCHAPKRGQLADPAALSHFTRCLRERWSRGKIVRATDSLKMKTNRGEAVAIVWQKIYFISVLEGRDKVVNFLRSQESSLLMGYANDFFVFFSQLGLPPKERVPQIRHSPAFAERRFCGPLEVHESY